MRTLLVLLFGIAITAGCTIDRNTARHLEEAQLHHTRLLAEQGALLREHSALLAQQIDEQQQMAEMLADMDRTLVEYRKRIAASVRTAPNSEPTLVVNEDGKAVLGRNEWVWLELLDRNIKARIDTGASSSSLSAVDLQPFEREGQNWIRFRVPDEEHPDGGETYESPLVRHVRIRQASADELERRPVVRLKVRLGKLADDAEFTLTNRGNMLYPLLLGRNFLRDVAVVDVARKFVQKKYSPERPDTAE